MKSLVNHLRWRLLVCVVCAAGTLASAQSLFAAIQDGDTTAFTAALQAEGVMNATDAYGQTPLMYAVTFNRLEMVAALLAAGASANAATHAGWTALHYAARDTSEAAILRALLEAGADPTLTNQAGDTPGAVAATAGNRAAADILAATVASRRTAPQVTETLPEAIPQTDQRQWLTVLGRGFARNAVVTLTRGNTDFSVPAERTDYVNEHSIRVQAGIFPPDATWTARVTNPDGAVSNRFTLQFETAPSTAAAATSPSSAATRLLGTDWRGQQAVLDHPLCTQGGCRYLGSERIEMQGRHYWTTHSFSMRQPEGINLEIVVGGPASRVPNQVSILGVRIADVNRFPVRSASALIEAMIRLESRNQSAVDVVNMCVTAADFSDRFASGSMRPHAGLQLNCAVTYGNVLTGRMLPNPTFMFDIARAN